MTCIWNIYMNILYFKINLPNYCAQLKVVLFLIAICRDRHKTVATISGIK